MILKSSTVDVVIVLVHNVRIWVRFAEWNSVDCGYISRT